MIEKNKNFLILVIVISLIFGGSAGVVGSLILTPYLKSLPLVQRFSQQINSELKNIGTTINVEEESASTEAVKKAIPAVVSITVSQEVSQYPDLLQLPFGYVPGQQVPPPTPQKTKQNIAGGTGFIVSSDGYILTNKHVIVDDTAEYTVVLNDDSKYTAKIVDKDFNNDLAILKIEGKNLPTVTLGNSDNLSLGQTVLAIGYTLGEYKNTVTKGVISGINRNVLAGDYFSAGEMIDGAIQTDTAVNPGNSGGPLINLSGEVIGINTAINSQGEAIGFAIPINIAKKVIDSVEKNGHIVRPWLGVRYVVINEEMAKANNLKFHYGALILPGKASKDLAVVPGSPADKAGLVENDIILEVNGVPLDKAMLANELQKYNPGEEIKLKIFHKGEEKTVTVKLVERQDDKK